MVLLNRKFGHVGLGMLGLDVHTKGIRTLATRLQEAGCDVSFLGEHLTVKQIVSQAIHADVDLIGISFSSRAYIDHCRDVVAEMRAQGAGDIPLMVGGLIHADDHATLHAMGIEGIFGPGSQLEDILAYLEKVAQARAEGGIT